MLLGFAFGFDDGLSNPISLRIEAILKHPKLIPQNHQNSHQTHCHARKLRCLCRLPPKKVLLFVLAIGLRWLIADSNIARSPTTILVTIFNSPAVSSPLLEVDVIGTCMDVVRAESVD
jgi:hypothetical protein